MKRFEEVQENILVQPSSENPIMFQDWKKYSIVAGGNAVDSAISTLFVLESLIISHLELEGKRH